MKRFLLKNKKNQQKVINQQKAINQQKLLLRINQIKKLRKNSFYLSYKYSLIIISIIYCLITPSLSKEKNIKMICKTDKISKKFSFLYLPDRNRVISVHEGREMKINKNVDNKINFTGYGVYGLGYDSWFKSNLFFDINLKSGDFKLTPDNEVHKNSPQIGKCISKKYF